MARPHSRRTAGQIAHKAFRRYTLHSSPSTSRVRGEVGQREHYTHASEHTGKPTKTKKYRKSALLIKNHGGGKRAVLGTIYHSPPPLAQLVMCLAFSRTRPAGERGEREGRECETESQRGSERERERGVGCVRYTEITAHMTTRRAITSQRSSGTPNCRYAVPR